MPSLALSIAQLGRGQNLMPLPRGEFIAHQLCASQTYGDVLASHATDADFVRKLERTRCIYFLAKRIRRDLGTIKAKGIPISRLHCRELLITYSSKSLYATILRSMQLSHDASDQDDRHAFAKLIAIGHAADHAAQTYLKSRHLVFVHRKYATDRNTRAADNMKYHDETSRRAFSKFGNVTLRRLPACVRSTQLADSGRLLKNRQQATRADSSNK